MTSEREPGDLVIRDRVIDLDDFERRRCTVIETSTEHDDVRVRFDDGTESDWSGPSRFRRVDDI